MTATYSVSLDIAYGEEPPVTRSGIRFGELHGTIARMVIGKLSSVVSDRAAADAICDAVDDMLAEALVHAAHGGHAPDRGHPMTARNGLLRIWEED